MRTQVNMKALWCWGFPLGIRNWAYNPIRGTASVATKRVDDNDEQKRCGAAWSIFTLIISKWREHKTPQFSWNEITKGYIFIWRFSTWIYHLTVENSSAYAVIDSTSSSWFKLERKQWKSLKKLEYYMWPGFPILFTTYSHSLCTLMPFLIRNTHLQQQPRAHFKIQYDKNVFQRRQFSFFTKLSMFCGQKGSAKLYII